MQTTLLTLGIAVILALVAALVGPAVIDWEQYHAEVEEQASRIVGVPVRVKGTIDVRLLPTPSVTLGDVQIGPADSSRKVSARGLSMELSLGNLMRGEFRANQVTLDRPEVRAGLDKNGVLSIPGLALNFDPDRLAIERLTITDGLLVLTDAASGTTLALEGLSASGDVGSLVGPFKLEGAFKLRSGRGEKGEHYAYKIAGGRRGDDGRMKIRLVLDGDERALRYESDGAVWTDGGSPRFEGTATLAPVFRKGDALDNQWKISSNVAASASAVQFKKMELSYGPEARVIRVSGEATLGLGANPRVSATLAARQIDFDRILSGGDQKRSPFETVKLMVDELAEAAAPQLPVHLIVGIDSLMAGGATVSSLHADVEKAADGWTLNRFEMRAPGATQVLVNGKLTLVADQHKEEFQGPVNVDSNDPAIFFAWIEGRSASGQPPLGPMRGNGVVTLGRERVAVDRLRAEIDRKPLQGRVAYRFATRTAPARLEAALSGAEFDYDRALAISSALFASTSFDRPGEIALALDIGHASFAGVEARKAQATLTYDRTGLKIERLSIDDIAGTSVSASGHLDNTAETWRGSVELALAAQRPESMTVLVDRFLPAAWQSRIIDALHRYGPRVAPLKLNGKLDVEPAAGGQTAAKLKLNGAIAGINVTVAGNGAGDIANPAAAAILVAGRLDAPDGRALASLAGLDALATADSRPARATFVVDGSTARKFAVDVRFTGPDLNASATGNLEESGNGMLDVALRAVNTRLPRRTGTAAVPADLRAHLAINGSDVAVTALDGKIATSSVKGNVTVGFGEPLRVNGQIDADQADAGELFAILTGVPRTAGTGPEWTVEPFGEPAAPPMTGRIAFRVATAQWPAGAPARDVTGAITFDRSSFSLADVGGGLAGGRFALDGELRHDQGGVYLHSHVKLTGADAPVLLGSVLHVPAAGRLSLEAEFQGQGLSPASLVGSANGTGTLAVENFEVGGLDPGAIDTVLKNLDADHGLAANSAKVAQIAGTALDAGKLKIASITTPIVIADGRAQLTGLQATAGTTDISSTIAVALADWQLNARFSMTAAPPKGAPGAERPVMTVSTRGPLAAARRTVDVAALINWAMQRSLDQETRRLEEAEKERRRMESQLDALRRQQQPPPDPAKQPDALPPPTDTSAPGQTGAPPPATGGDRRLRIPGQ